MFLDFSESKPLVSPEEKAKLVTTKAQGLALLSKLHDSQFSATGKALAALVPCLASFTKPGDPWTSRESHRLAQSTLSKLLENVKDTPKAFENLIIDLLHDHVKPLFLKSKSHILTEAGRKAISPIAGNNNSTDFESTNEPWKFQAPHIVTVFRWILSQLDAALVEAHWPLIIPPLLTIIDDVSISYKIKGCELLRLLVQVAPANLLERSGLGEVFHNTLMPYLLYLPSLTPEKESVPLLDATYDALIALTLARYGSLESGTKRIKALDEVFRYGILKGYEHAGENVRIAELLLKKSANLVDAMRIYCVKHLKDLLPMISAALTAPFALAYPPLLAASLQTLRVIVVNAWPRIAYHRGEILEGLIICWCGIADEDDGGPQLKEIQGSIQDILHAVVQILKDDEDAMREIQTLPDCGSRLGAILKI